MLPLFEMAEQQECGELHTSQVDDSGGQLLSFSHAYVNKDGDIARMRNTKYMQDIITI
jgi:hypothetical protein